MPRKSIHPTFYPDPGIWEYEGFGACTIRELLKVLPKRTKIKDYYPNGDTQLPPWPVEEKNTPFNKPLLMHVQSDAQKRRGIAFQAAAKAKALEQVLPKLVIVSQPEPKPVLQPKPKIERVVIISKSNYEATLDLWAKGLKSPIITQRLHISKSRISRILTQARKVGDVRALRRELGNWTLDKERNLSQMLANNVPRVEIEKQLDIPKNALAGKIWRMRRDKEKAES